MQSIGIDWKILIPQIVNFLVLFFVLRWLLYKPILNILNERRKKIETSLAIAEKTKKESEELDKKIKENIEKSKKEALAILEEAKKQAETTKKEITSQAGKEAEYLLKKAEERIREQKVELQKEIRNDVVNLTISVTEKIIGKNLDKATSEKLASEAINEINTKG